MDGPICLVRQWRQRRGISQQALADAAGVSRQTISGLEQGAYAPSTLVALRLARALGCAVEDLFCLPEEAGLPVTWLRPPEGSGVRVALAQVGERTVAWPLTGRSFPILVPAADGVVAGDGHVQPLPGDRWQETLLVAGCDPGLAILGQHSQRVHPHLRPLWHRCGNQAALGALQAGHVHLAAVHRAHDAAAGPEPALHTDESGELRWLHLAAWQQGLMVAPDNPLGFGSIADLADPRVRLVNREPGAGARHLLDRLLAEVGIEPQRVTGYGTQAAGHLEVAQVIAGGLADVGIGLASVARAYGLGFIPLTQERCDLAVPAALWTDPRVAAALDALQSAAFRADLSALGEYDLTHTGDLVSPQKEWLS